MGQLGIKHAKIYCSLHETSLVCVADNNEEHLKAATDQFNVKGYNNASDLCARADLDAISICTPDYAHMDPALIALSYGKNIFIEKPLTDNINEARSIVDAGKCSDTKIMVGHLLRFDPRYVGAKIAIQQGNIGEVVHIYAKRNSYISGPLHYGNRYKLIYHLAIHEIDLVSWIVDSPIVSVYAEAVGKVLKVDGMDDAIFTIMKLANGTIVSLENSWILSHGCSAQTLGPEMEIVGTKGSIHIYGINGIEILTNENLLVPDIGVFSSLIDGTFTGCLSYALRSFIDCLIHNTDSPVSSEEGFRAVKVATAIEKSLSMHSQISISIFNCDMDNIAI
jgi:predicted dehydrogenase